MPNEFEITSLPNGWQVGQFAVMADPALAHAVTTKQGLDVHIVRHEHARAGEALAAALGAETAAHVEQVHGGRVLAVDRPGYAGQADGLVTRQRDLVIWMRGADCPLLLAADVEAGVVGTAHASWRGTVAKVTQEMIRQMQAMGARPERTVVGICPSAGPCCYEVGPEVRQQVLDQLGPHAEAFFIPRGHGIHFDLWSANRDQLLGCGVAAEHIHISGLCTMCRNDIFPSHRKEADQAGRLAAGICLLSS